ncbi:hypothetical protein MMC07_002572 [Pseudocyphellaria aurata]|nr:hypothetical protein [Pseudocyphellaria aurata]
MATYPLKGIPLPEVPDPIHRIPVRQEIDAWYMNRSNDIQLSLFIQAMGKFMKMDYREQLSFFQIAGIHGQPYTDWDGLKGREFCSHNTSIFPTWHRPYVLLLEQRLYEIMLDIIGKDVPHDHQAKWKTEASHWRFPYWDWAAKSKVHQDFTLPLLVTSQYVDILTLPDMLIKTVKNPLWQFDNPANVPMGSPSMGKYALTSKDQDDPNAAFYYWTRAFSTSKWGIRPKPFPEANWIHGSQQNELVNIALQHPAWYSEPIKIGSIAEAVYRMFAPGYFSSWEAFASTLYVSQNPGATNFLSLEFIHNNIHNFVGGSDLKTGIGQMSDVPVAAFDPVFWLHHCNVDRQLAIWQTLNPDKWFDAPLKSDTKPTDHLNPFHYDKNSHSWDSNRARDWTHSNYQYDTLEPPKSVYNEHGELNRDLWIAELRRILNEKYSNTRHELLSSPRIEGNKNDYIINILYDRYALDGQSYTIHFFLGNIEGGPESYATHPNQIGMVYTFSSGTDDARCANCKDQKDQGLLSTAQIHLTVPLLKYARDPAERGINNLIPDEVRNYLSANLTWKAEVLGRPIEMSRLPRTKIYVLKGTADHHSDARRLSNYYDYTPMYEVCAGKPGAAHESDGLE